MIIVTFVAIVAVARINIGSAPLYILFLILLLFSTFTFFIRIKVNSSVQSIERSLLMNPIQSYLDLDVYNVAMLEAKVVYKLIDNLPSRERNNLVDQLMRAVTSIPSNISEGQSRASTKEFLYFLSIAKGSNSEVQTQVTLGARLGYFPMEDVHTALTLNKRVGQMLNALMKKLEWKQQMEGKN